MKKIVILLTCCLLATLPAAAQKTKAEVIKSIDFHVDQYAATAKKIWDFAEVGFQEKQSSALLQQMLKDAGFAVQDNIAGMPTAGSGRRRENHRNKGDDDCSEDHGPYRYGPVQHADRH